MFRQTAESSRVGFIFSGSAGEIVGPKKTGAGFHLFEIMQKHKKGSERGLELVYDEIYERLYKQKSEAIVVSTIDSLYLSSDVFISAEVR